MRKQSVAKKNTTPAVTGNAPWRVSYVKALSNHCLEVEFFDGAEGIVDMEKLIYSPHAGVFSQLQDVDLFNQVFLEYGVVTWPGELDLAPDSMHEAIKKHGKFVPS